MIKMELKLYHFSVPQVMQKVFTNVLKTGLMIEMKKLSIHILRVEPMVELDLNWTKKVISLRPTNLAQLLRWAGLV